MDLETADSVGYRLCAENHGSRKAKPVHGAVRLASATIVATALTAIFAMTISSNAAVPPPPQVPIAATRLTVASPRTAPSTTPGAVSRNGKRVGICMNYRFDHGTDVGNGETASTNGRAIWGNRAGVRHAAGGRNAARQPVAARRTANEKRAK